jgi:hypothetical protein
MRIAAAMITVERPERQYLGETLRNLERAGGLSDSPFWIVDSGSSPAYLAREAGPGSLPGRYQIETPGTDHRRSLNANAARALALASDEDADFVLMMQDDLDFCADFYGSLCRWLADHYQPHWLLYSFGTTWPPVHRAALDGATSAPYPIGQFFGTQCYALSISWARRLARWFEDAWPRLSSDSKGRRVYDDIILHRWARDMNPDARHFLASAPSFVQHVGESSSIGSHRFTFPSWPGREWSYASPGYDVERRAAR